MTALTDLEVANLALGQLAVTDVLSALTGTRTEVTWINKYLTSCKREVLGAHHWSFAKTRLALTDVTANLVNELDDWEYAYTYPADCVTDIRIWDGKREPSPSDERIAYAVGSELMEGDPDPDYQAKVILTDEPSAKLIYITSSFAVDGQTLEYQEAIAALLAAKIAMPVTKKPDVARAALNYAELMLQRAIAKDKNSGHEDKAPESRFIRAR